MAPPAGRAQLLRGLGARSAAAAVAVLWGEEEARARTTGALFSGWKEAYEELIEYRVPTLQEPQPDGWGVVVQPIGLDALGGGTRNNMGDDPLLVCFYSPPRWRAQVQRRDSNGASGTVSTTDFRSGDSGTLYVDTKFKEKYNKLETLRGEDIAAELEKAVTRKGSPARVTVTKILPGPAGSTLAEFEYSLAAQSGTDFDRIGIASLTQVGDSGNLQIFYCVSIQPRWEDVKTTIRQLVVSFRVAKLNQSFKRKFQSLVQSDDDDD